MNEVNDFRCGSSFSLWSLVRFNCSALNSDGDYWQPCIVLNWSPRALSKCVCVCAQIVELCNFRLRNGCGIWRVSDFSHRGATMLATSLAQLLRHLVCVGSPLLWHCDDFDIDRSRCGAVWILNFPRSSATSSRQIPCWAQILHRYLAKRSGRNLGHVSYQEILLRSCQVILRRDPAQVFPKRSMFFAQDLL